MPLHPLTKFISPARPGGNTGHRPEAAGCWGSHYPYIRWFQENTVRCLRTGSRSGFTFVEVVIALIIVLLSSITVIGAIGYTRQALELEKQRIAAMNYCRQAMEAIQSLDTAEAGTKRLVPFNSPTISDLDATLTLEYFELNSNGTVDFGSPRTEPLVGRPVFARARVRWLPYGSVARPQEISMATIVTRGID